MIKSLSGLKSGQGASADRVWIAGTSILFFALGLLIVCFLSWQAAPVALMAALGASAVGAIIGFLFGIPKALSDDGQAAAKNGGPQDGAAIKDNTNLEQISDWLTKILVGAGLVEFRELSTQFTRVARALGSGLAPISASSAVAFSVFLLAYYAIWGFLTAYLLTRLYLPGTMSRAQSEIAGMRQTIEKVETELDSLKKLVESDPNKGRFGGISEGNGRKLTAVVGQEPDENDRFPIMLKVVSTLPDRPLAGDVTFYLHPTLSPDVRPVSSTGGIASLQLEAWGAFTVGVVADEGKTLLELDLSELPEAPLRFRNR